MIVALADPTTTEGLTEIINLAAIHQHHMMTGASL